MKRYQEYVREFGYKHEYSNTAFPPIDIAIAAIGRMLDKMNGFNDDCNLQKNEEITCQCKCHNS